MDDKIKVDLWEAAAETLVEALVKINNLNKTQPATHQIRKREINEISENALKDYKKFISNYGK